MKRLSEITKREIVDLLNVGVGEFRWFGGLNDVGFLKRLYKLDTLPSHDRRHATAEEDIWKHTVANDDWRYDWVFTDDRFGLEKGEDRFFLRFLCEMFHPAVVDGRITADGSGVPSKYLREINELLSEDGYQLVADRELSGWPVFSWKETISSNQVIEGQLRSLTQAFDSEYISAQISQMNEAILLNPTDAIGKAKELLESCCKTILEARSVVIDKNWEVPKLVKETCKVLRLTPEDIPDAAKASGTIKSILHSLATFSHGMAELRNPYGSGHGKSATYKGLSSRHARMAVGAATTVVNFIWETYVEQSGTGKDPD